MNPRSIRSASGRSASRVALSAAGCALLLAAAAGCGSETGDDSGTASDSSTSEATPTDTPTSVSPTVNTGSGASVMVGDVVEPGQAVIVSASNVKVEAAPRASALVNDEAIDAFVASLDEQFGADVRAAAAKVQVPADSTLFGSVVSVGCETPTTVEWGSTFDGVEVQATLPKPGVQCLVPVTSIALFLVPADA